MNGASAAVTSSSSPVEAAPVEQRLTRRFSLQRLKEQAIGVVLFGCASLSILTTMGIIFVLFSEAVVAIPPGTAFFQEVSLVEFFTETRWTPQYAEKHFGILPLIGGTFLVAGIAAMIGLPLGLLSAIYLSEYASHRTRSVMKPVLEVLAGIPSVVYGFFALVFVTPYVLRPIFQDLLGFDVGVFNAASAGIVVGVMIMPLVTSLSEDVLRAVPQHMREAGYALGSTRFDVSVRIVVPAGLSGVLAAFILAISRAVGETMAVAIAAGQMTPTMSLNPFQSTETMTAFIVSVSMGDTPAGSIEYKSLYAVALTLFVITLGMNVVSRLILRRFREVYQ